MDDLFKYDNTLLDRHHQLVGIQHKSRDEEEELYFINRVFSAQTSQNNSMNKTFTMKDREDIYGILTQFISKIALNTVEDVYDTHNIMEDLLNKHNTTKDQISWSFDLISTAKYANFKSLEKAKEFLRQEICYVLTKNEEDIWNQLCEIKYLDEMDTVLRFLYLSEVGKSNISTLEWRDKKKIHKDKKDFEKKREIALKFSKENGLPTKEIKQSQFLYPLIEKHFLYLNYQQTVKHLRSTLEKHLHKFHRTPKRRATKISELIKFI